MNLTQLVHSPVLPKISKLSLRETQKIVLNIRNFSIYAGTTGALTQDEAAEDEADYDEEEDDDDDVEYMDEDSTKVNKGKGNGKKKTVIDVSDDEEDALEVLPPPKKRRAPEPATPAAKAATGRALPASVSHPSQLPFATAYWIAPIKRCLLPAATRTSCCFPYRVYPFCCHHDRCRSILEARLHCNMLVSRACCSGLV